MENYEYLIANVIKTSCSNIDDKYELFVIAKFRYIDDACIFMAKYLEEHDDSLCKLAVIKQSVEKWSDFSVNKEITENV